MKIKIKFNLIYIAVLPKENSYVLIHKFMVMIKRDISRSGRVNPGPMSDSKVRLIYNA